MITLCLKSSLSVKTTHHFLVGVRLSVVVERDYEMHLLICSVFNWPFAALVVISQTFFLIRSYPLTARAESGFTLYLVCRIYPQPAHDAEELSRGRTKLCSHCH